MGNETLPGLPAPVPVPIGPCVDCAKPGEWRSDRYGARCREHVPVVSARARVKLVKVEVPVVEIKCSDCGHSSTVSDERMVRAVKEQHRIKGKCPRCGVTHQVWASFLHEPSAKEQRAIAKLKGVP
jgi:phage FluMu protein Com